LQRLFRLIGRVCAARKLWPLAEDISRKIHSARMILGMASRSKLAASVRYLKKRSQTCRFAALGLWRVAPIVPLLWLLRPASALALQGAKTASTQQAVASGSAEAPIVFWNRQIAVLRTTLVDVAPEVRAEHAVERFNELPLNTRTSDLTLVDLEVEDHKAVAFVYRGRPLFYLTDRDVDREAGQTLAQMSQSALSKLDEALEARRSERRWPVIRAGIFFTVTGMLLLAFISFGIWRSHHQLAAYVGRRESSLPRPIRLFGLNLVPYIAAALRFLLRTLAWALTLIATYLWLTLSLRRFPYTEPWAERLGSYVVQLLRQFAQQAINALPGFFAVVIIAFVARAIVRLAQAFFAQVTSGSLRLPWMDPDIALATERIFSAVVWVFAAIVAYPYIPGSNTAAFKGISVFFGLVISLGSTGIINQVMSGLFVVYSKALKTGEWVVVNSVEGEVLEVGLLAAKIRTIEGQEVTVPNSLLVGTTTTNFTRLGHPDGMIASATVTIGYDTPWRQVHTMLLLAAGRTANIRERPAPYVLQRQLSDFYVEYTLIVRLHDEKLRIETLSDLHGGIQDAFNEYGVQIMSPHYFTQPEKQMVVPPSKWYQPPASKPETSSRS
jgi:small-conductance mechanosensitive channel